MASFGLLFGVTCPMLEVLYSLLAAETDTTRFSSLVPVFEELGLNMHDTCDLLIIINIIFLPISEITIPPSVDPLADFRISPAGQMAINTKPFSLKESTLSHSIS